MTSAGSTQQREVAVFQVVKMFGFSGSIDKEEEMIHLLPYGTHLFFRVQNLVTLIFSPSSTGFSSAFPKVMWVFPAELRLGCRPRLGDREVCVLQRHCCFIDQSSARAFNIAVIIQFSSLFSVIYLYWLDCAKSDKSDCWGRILVWFIPQFIGLFHLEIKCIRHDGTSDSQMDTSWFSAQCILRFSGSGRICRELQGLGQG